MAEWSLMMIIEERRSCDNPSLLTMWSRVLLGKLTDSQLVKKFPEGSLPHFQLPATCPYPEPDQSSPLLPHATS